MRLIILGAGGYGQTISDLAQQSGRYEEIFFLDDQKQAEDVLGTCSEFRNFIDQDTEMYPAFGNNEGRINWINCLREEGVMIPTLIHKTAYVSPRATIEQGTMVLPGAIVNTDCHVQSGCIVNCGAVIDHGCVIEEGVHICLNTVIKAENRIPRCMKIEAGEVIPLRTYPVGE